MNEQPIEPTQSGRPVAVITGASSGIGKAAAKALLQLGWRVVGLGRNKERCQQASTELQEAGAEPNQFTMLNANLAMLSEVETAANAINLLTSRVDVLLNNAGGVTATLNLTAEGNENTFASNYLGHFMLTQRLLPLLKITAACATRGATRVINVSSSAHLRAGPFDWDNLQLTAEFSPGAAYCQAKLATLLFNTALADRIAKDNIVVHAMHPGVVASNFASHGDEAMRQHLANAESIDPQQAAETLIWLACSPEPGQSTGGYFFNCQPADINPLAADPKIANKLWHETETLIARSMTHDGV